MKLAQNIRRFLALHPADRRLFMQAELLFILVGPGLKIIGLRRCQRLLQRLVTRQRPMPAPADAPTSARRTVTMMRMAARHTLGQPTCLPQSLVCLALLRRQGIEGDLRIGTRRDGGKFEAHAWVEYQGQVLNDRPDVRQRFAPFNQPIDPARIME